MKKACLMLFALIFLTACNGQINSNNTMKNNLPEGVWFQKNYDILWKKDDDGKDYLTQITIQKPKPYFYNEEQDAELFDFKNVVFSMDYSITSKHKLSRMIHTCFIVFVKNDSATNYKLYVASILSSWDYRENIFSSFKPMHYDPLVPKYQFIGYSDDENLEQVKVLNIAKKDFDLEANLKLYKEQ